MPSDFSYCIRPATVSDVPQLCAMEKECFSDPWSEAAFLSFTAGTGPFATDLLTDGDGTLLGYVCLVKCTPEWEIANVAVSPAFRRRGLGQTLISHVLRSSREEGAQTLYLEARASNAPALSLYEKNGFVRVGTRTKYYVHPCEDAVLMTLRL